jgi:hypothetical protein
MITAREEMNSVPEKLPGRFFGETEPSGSIFAIRDYNVYRMAVHQSMQFLGYRLPSGLADDICDKKNLNGHIRPLLFP